MKIRTAILSLLIPIMALSCIEDIDLQSKISFEDILVVEATITDKIERQEINLSRSYPLEFEGPREEAGSLVKVIGNNREYLFEEIQPGRYVSNEPFAAEVNKDYKLQIITSDGKRYESFSEILSGESIIESLTYDIGFNENNEEGISILVTPNISSDSPEFYRFTYKETYKIIAPLYSVKELIALFQASQFPMAISEEFAGFTTITEVINYLVDIQLKEEQQQVCYNTVASNTIILSQVEDFSNGGINNKQIRFLNKNNYIISHRYSIIVDQIGQSREANTFYRILKEISEDNETIFSTLQPGFFNGNVFSVTNPEEKVAGFFEVASVDSKRIYFNYSDLFPGEQLPPYVVECGDLRTPKLLNTDGDGNLVRSPLINALENEQKFYLDSGYDEDESPFEAKPFVLVVEECGDCTVLGNNMPPDFWVE